MIISNELESNEYNIVIYSFHALFSLLKLLMLRFEFLTVDDLSLSESELYTDAMNSIQSKKRTKL